MEQAEGAERFGMVKKRHFGTFETAVGEKKADPKIISLCRFLNRQPEFFTASSCSGRITLMELDSEENKRESAFFYKKHGSVKAGELWKKLHGKNRYNLWFKQEPFILHIGTNSLENANRVLECGREAGIKRQGIMVAKPGKFILELIGTQGMAIPVKKKQQILVQKDFFSTLVRMANQKLERNSERLQKFEQIAKKKLGPQQ